MKDVTKTDNTSGVYFDDFDFDHAKTIKHPLVKKLKENAKSSSSAPLLDSDVAMWLAQQDQNTQRHINEMIRHVMAMQLA